jgi:hypothetical protein
MSGVGSNRLWQRGHVPPAHGFHRWPQHAVPIYPVVDARTARLEWHTIARASADDPLQKRSFDLYQGRWVALILLRQRAVCAFSVALRLDQGGDHHHGDENRTPGGVGS